MDAPIPPFRPVDPKALPDNPFDLLGRQWMLVTAGPRSAFNTMTASWGALGVLWNRDCAFVVVRPTRHTFRFMEGSTHFTLSFFGEEHRAALEFCGAHSGRTVDKCASTGLTPVETSPGCVAFAQARLVMECRKIYFQDLDPEKFLDATIHENYPERDYHRLYAGEIVRCLAR
jgi:flavin reductase (DIM6/NTAB) family NADH-FMN oxidoreductase RutF